MAYLKLCLKY